MSIKVDPRKLELLPVPGGFRIRIRHHYLPKIENGREVKGHLTKTVALLFPVGMSSENYVSVGEAVVSPKDMGNKGLGRAIAHNRAIKNFKKNSQAAQQQQPPTQEDLALVDKALNEFAELISDTEQVRDGLRETAL